MMRALLFLFLASCALASCAPSNMVALLADPDGHVGKVVVSNPAGTQTIDTAKTVVTVASATASPAAATPISDSDIQKYWGSTIAALPARPEVYNLYFENGTADLTQESQQALPNIVARAKGWVFPHIAVAGHTDAVGADDANAVLSKQRADSVRDDLVKAGIAPDEIDSAGFGSGDPLVPTPRGTPEPQNRRVSVTIQ